jgi:hypothetical protein
VRRGQDTIPRLSKEITYILRAVKGRDEVNVPFCGCPTRSRTGCGESKGKTRSERHSVAIRQDHVLPTRGKWARRRQHAVLQLSNEFTYSLRAIEGKMRSACPSAPSNEITYSLWVMNGQKRSTCRSTAIQRDYVQSEGGQMAW